MILAILLVLGLLVGSFVNAWVWRTYKQMHAPEKSRTKYSITKGRSMCTACKHPLSSLDLMPVLSWLMLKGRCRYCKTSISPQYPIVELATSALFGLSYILWPNSLTGIALIEFGLWLVLLTALIALAVFDLLHMLLPNRMIVVAAIPVIIWIALDTLLVSRSVAPLVSTVYGLLAFGGLFYALFTFSDGKWIGGGDVKLGFVLGAWLSSALLSALAIFTASFIGVLVFLILAVSKKASLQSKIPFGPMLIAGSIVSFYYGNTLIDMYSRTLMGI